MRVNIQNYLLLLMIHTKIVEVSYTVTGAVEDGRRPKGGHVERPR